MATFTSVPAVPKRSMKSLSPVQYIYSAAVGASVPPGAVVGAVARVGFPGGGTCVKRMVERGTGPPVELCALVGASFGCLKTEWE